MKKAFKVFMSLIIVVFNFLNLFVCSISAKDEQSVNFKLLESLNIIDEKFAECDLNREMFARVCIGISMPESVCAQGKSSIFDDVYAAQEYSGYCIKAAELGMMNGKNGKFIPNGPVSKADITYAFLRLIANEYMIDPTYLLDENGDAIDKLLESRIFEDVKIKDTSCVTVEEAVDVVYNLLMMEFSVNGNIDFSERTLLKKKFNVKTKAGVFLPESIYGTDASGVYIGSEKYECNADIDYNLVAKKVLAYIRDDVVIFVDGEKYKNKTLTVFSNDIVNVLNDTFSYIDENERRKTFDLTGINVIYNGSLVEYDQSLFEITNGDIVFVDNSRSGYTYAIISEYFDFVVGVKNKNVLIDKYESSSTIPLNQLMSFSVWLDGKEVDSSEIRTNDVLSVYLSQDRARAKIIISRNSTNGNVESIDSDNSSIAIGYKEYKYSDYFYNNFNLGIGSEGIFYLNFNNTVVCFDSVSEWKYGYVYSLKTFDDSNTGNTVTRMEIFTSANNMEKLYLAEKVSVNGIREKNVYADEDNALTRALKVQVVAGSDKSIDFIQRKDMVRQIIKYKTDMNGNINKILTAQPEGAVDKDNALIISVAHDKQYEQPGEEYNYKYIAGGFFNGGVYFKVGVSAVFYAPFILENTFDRQGNVDEGRRNSVSKKAYMCIDEKNYTISEAKYNILAYDVTEGGLAKCMVIENESAGASVATFSETNKKIMVVNKVNTTLTDDDEVSYKIYGMHEFEERNYTLSYEFVQEQINSGNIKMPEKGDVIQFSLDESGEINRMANRFSLSTKTVACSGWSWDLYGDECGWVYGIDEYGMKIIRDLEDQGTTKFISFSNVNTVYIYNLEDDTIIVGGTSDAIPYSKSTNMASYAFVRTTHGRPSELVIYLK